MMFNNNKFFFPFKKKITQIESQLLLVQLLFLRYTTIISPVIYIYYIYVYMSNYSNAEDGGGD